MKNISVYSFAPKVIAFLIAVLGILYFYSNWKGLIQYAYDEIAYEQVEGYIKLASRQEGKPGQFIVDYWFTQDGRMESGKHVGSYSENLESLLTKLNDTLKNEQQVTIYLTADGESKISLFSYVDNGDYIQSLFVFLACLSMATAIFSQGTRQLLRLKYGYREPWKTYSIYGDNRIVGHVNHNLLLLWALSLAWTTFGLIFSALVSESVNTGEIGNEYKLLYIFPLIGILLLIKCVHDTWQWLRLGRATLHLLDFPPRKGCTLSGLIIINREHDIFSSYKVDLFCYQKDSKDISPYNSIFNKSYNAGACGVEGKTKVNFEIDLLQIPDISEEDIEWRIQLDPNLPDINPKYAFDIPVCDNDTPSQSYELDLDLPSKPLHKEGFGFGESTAGGAPEYQGYNPGLLSHVLVLFVTGAVFFGSGLAIFSIAAGEDGLFNMVTFGVPGVAAVLAALLIFWAFFRDLLVRTRVVVFTRSLKIVKSIFGMTISSKEIERDDIKEILVERNSGGRSDGRRSLDNGIAKRGADYSISLITHNGDQYQLFDDLPNEAVAKHLVGKLHEEDVWRYAAT